MSDNTRLNRIENDLKNNPSSVSTNDLIYFLKIMSKNKSLNPTNLSKTQEYLNQINNSFFYENIFVNKNNYSTIVVSIIGLLLPFYYFYPRFYNIGFWSVAIGFISLITLFTKTNNLYSNFFSNSGLIFIILTIFIYLIFFILLNKLNHISLFFISAVISFVIINYVFKLILTIPIKSNPYSKYTATMNNNTQYTQYNLLIESACFQVIDRFDLKLPSGNMLYSYLTVFEIGQNNNEMNNFLTNVFSPLLSIGILYFLGDFLSKIEYENEDGKKVNDINIFPIIGNDSESKNFFSCQANYILPKELNVDLLIHNIIDKYNFEETVYDKIQKAFVRISNELLEKYNPKFKNLNNIDKNIILENLKDNKIFQSINKILKKSSLNFDINYIDEIKNLINNEELPYKEKEKMLELLKQINNTLLVINKVNKKYQNDSILARDELLYDKEINDNYKGLIKKITDEYIKNFTDNLNLKKGILFGYDYNIMTYSWLSQNIRLKSNDIFSFIIGLISVWILFAKPIGSPLLFAKYIINNKFEFKEFIENLTENSFIWKYFSMGLDKSSLEETLKKLAENKKETIIEDIWKYIKSGLLFLFLFPLFYFYNSVNFGMSLSPSWYNILYQIIFILNILGNYYCYYNNGSYLLYNIKFLITFIIIFIIISIIRVVINNIK
jgi:hypothetical protein